MTTSPSDLLVAAADRIRDLAAAATQQGWEVRGLYRMAEGCRCMSCTEDEPWAYEVWPLEGPEGDAQCIYATHLAKPDAEWVAALSPAVSPMIENWLRLAALSFETGDAVAEGSDYAALALARLLCPELADEDGDGRG